MFCYSGVDKLEEELISKKELLEMTGISYGQLYRWKRMDIIPESWFIKKSSFTGQETYFPKERILERVHKIIELKDGYSLEELAKFFSPNPTEIELTLEELPHYRIISEEVLNTYKTKQKPVQKKLEFNDIFYLYLCEQITYDYQFPMEELIEQLKFVKQLKGTLEKQLELIAIKKNQQFVWMIVPFPSSLLLEDAATLEVKINIDEKMNELKIKLSELSK